MSFALNKDKGKDCDLHFLRFFSLCFERKNCLTNYFFFFPPTHSNHALGGVGVAPGSIWQYSLKILANLFLQDSSPLPRPFLSLKSQSKSRENVVYPRKRHLCILHLQLYNTYSLRPCVPQGTKRIGEVT